MKKIFSMFIFFVFFLNTVFAATSSRNVVKNWFYFGKYNGRDGLYIMDNKDNEEFVYSDWPRIWNWVNSGVVDHDKLILWSLLFRSKRWWKPSIYQQALMDWSNTNLNFMWKDWSFMIFDFCLDNKVTVDNVCKILSHQYSISITGQMSGTTKVYMTKNWWWAMYIVKRAWDYIVVTQNLNDLWNTIVTKSTTKQTNAKIKLSQKVYIINVQNGKILDLWNWVDRDYINIKSKKPSVTFQRFYQNTKTKLYVVSNYIERKLP